MKKINNMSRIKNPVKLGFNPKDPNLSSEMREIFSKPIARTIWMAYKQTHLEGPEVKRTILNLVDRFEERGLPKDVESFHAAMSINLGVGDENFSRELYNYLTGKEKLRYEIK